jgi:hypothetical protein
MGMARILPLKVSRFGVQLDSIVNVSQKVGPPAEECPNLKNDVDAVEKLLLLWMSKSIDGQSISNNGIFDPVTGYFIYRFQNQLKNDFGLSGQIMDGIVSPAKSVGYGGNSLYTIVLFNLQAKAVNPSGYEQFRRSFVCTG